MVSISCTCLLDKTEPNTLWVQYLLTLYGSFLAIPVDMDSSGEQGESEMKKNGMLIL